MFYSRARVAFGSAECPAAALVGVNVVVFDGDVDGPSRRGRGRPTLTIRGLPLLEAVVAVSAKML
jgi:hypothetical protein